jgi:hypothetical protein
VSRHEAGDERYETGPRPRTGARASRTAAAAALALLALPGVAFALGRQSQEVTAIPVAVGDIVKVNGAPLACKVRFQNGLRAVDCRKTGPLAGTYGTIITGAQVMVVRYESVRSGKVVFSAHHRRLRAHVCG